MKVTPVPLKFTTEPKVITLPPTLFLYLEKIGPFLQTAPAAWKQLLPLLTGIREQDVMCGAGLSRIDKTKTGDDAFILQAGLLLKSQPDAVPVGLKLRTLAEGRYASFMLSGSYAQLPEAYTAAFALVAKSAFSLREDFCIEKYLTNPATTPEDQLKTEILVPVV